MSVRSAQAIRFKGRSYFSLTISPELPLDGWMERLDGWLERSPGFFSRNSVILDIRDLGLDRARARRGSSPTCAAAQFACSASMAAIPHGRGRTCRPSCPRARTCARPRANPRRPQRPMTRPVRRRPLRPRPHPAAGPRRSTSIPPCARDRACCIPMAT